MTSYLQGCSLFLTTTLKKHFVYTTFLCIPLNYQPNSIFFHQAHHHLPQQCAQLRLTRSRCSRASSCWGAPMIPSKAPDCLQVNRIMSVRYPKQNPNPRRPSFVKGPSLQQLSIRSSPLLTHHPGVFCALLTQPLIPAVVVWGPLEQEQSRNYRQLQLAQGERTPLHHRQQKTTSSLQLLLTMVFCKRVLIMKIQGTIISVCDATK